MSRVLVGGTLAAALSVCLLGAGCSTVIGLDNYKVASSGAGGLAGSSGVGGGSSGVGGGSSGVGGGSSGVGGGSSGSAGISGTAGVSGSAGISGTAGSTGASGSAGASGTAGSSGTSGSAGASGTAGSSGTSGSAGASGTAGSSGTSGSAGASGTGGAATVGCNGMPFTPNQAVIRSCVLRVGCSPFNPDRTISECVTRNTQKAFGDTCNLAAQTCAAVGACEHVTLITDTTSCAGTRANTEFCLNNRAYHCDNAGFNWYRDCTTGGATGCALDSYQTAYCTFPGTCPAGTSFACAPDKTYFYECDPGRLGGLCAPGYECNIDPNAPACTPISKGACTTDSATCSTGGQAVQCLTGEQFTWDCASVGLGCASSTADPQGNRGYCLAPGCTPADVNNCTEACNGTRLTMCYGGQPYTIDCASYGFNTCSVFNPTSGPVTAYAACYTQ